MDYLKQKLTLHALYGFNQIALAQVKSLFGNDQIVLGKEIVVENVSFIPVTGTNGDRLVIPRDFFNFDSLWQLFHQERNKIIGIYRLEASITSDDYGKINGIGWRIEFYNLGKFFFNIETLSVKPIYELRVISKVKEKTLINNHIIVDTFSIDYFAEKLPKYRGI